MLTVIRVELLHMSVDHSTLENQETVFGTFLMSCRRINAAFVTIPSGVAAKSYTTRTASSAMSALYKIN